LRKCFSVDKSVSKTKTPSSSYLSDSARSAPTSPQRIDELCSNKNGIDPDVDVRDLIRKTSDRHLSLEDSAISNASEKEEKFEASPDLENSCNEEEDVVIDVTSPNCDSNFDVENSDSRTPHDVAGGRNRYPVFPSTETKNVSLVQLLNATDDNEGNCL